MFCYSNDGQSYRMVTDDHVAGSGEALFAALPTDQQLSVAFPDDAAAQKAKLVAYAMLQQQALAAAGTDVAVGDVSVHCSTDGGSLAMLQGAMLIAQSDPARTFCWVQSTGAAVTLTGAQIQSMFVAVSDFIQSTFNRLAATIGQVNSGAITTTAQVDAAFV